MEIEIVIAFATEKIACVRRWLVVDSLGVGLIEAAREAQREWRGIVEGAQERLAALGEWASRDLMWCAATAIPPARTPAVRNGAAKGDAPGIWIGGIEWRRLVRADRWHLAGMPPGRRRSTQYERGGFDEYQAPDDGFGGAKPGQEEGARLFAGRALSSDVLRCTEEIEDCCDKLVRRLPERDGARGVAVFRMKRSRTCRDIIRQL